MRKELLAMLALALAIPTVAQERKTIYVDKMEGLEPFVEQAQRPSWMIGPISSTSPNRN